MPPYPPVEIGFCQCGCGIRTTVCVRTRPEFGHVAGEYHKFVKGHSSKKPPFTIDPTTGCWVWQRKTIKSGYGSTWHNGRSDLAHRVFWERTNGSIPVGMEIHHRCFNRLCVNIEHLELATPAYNARHRSNGKLAEADVLLIRESSLRNADLARELGVHPSTVSMIRHDKRWKEAK